MIKAGPIGVFDSGYGGLTVLKEFINKLPQYDYLYLGDNARAPYGTRSFETVYEYTLQCVKELFKRDCRLVILACNTASAKALRSIQQKDLPEIDPSLRVLGVIRPTTELVGEYTKTNKVGVFATRGTVASQSYVVEINKFFPEVEVFQEACPMWVPLVENNEYASPGADYFIQKHIDKLLAAEPQIDTILLGCTHYPLLADKIRKYTPSGIRLVSQGEIVANSLSGYLKRHPEVERYCTRGATRNYLTTGDTDDFNTHASTFLGQEIFSQHVGMVG